MLSSFFRKQVVVLLISVAAVVASGCMWGVVRDAQTGAPIAGASVSYTDSHGNTGTTTSDANGIYAFDQTKTNAPAIGWATIEVDAAGYDRLTESREILYNDGWDPTLANLATFWELQGFDLTRGGLAPSYEGQPSLGPQDAPVIFIEFSDFQCPYCAVVAADVIPQVQRDFGDRVLIVFRNYPLTSMHPYAFVAAEAGECAFAQGMFWQYYNALFANRALDPGSLKSYAAAIGLDTATFDNCLDTNQTANAVYQDMADFEAAARAAGATSFGTPAFFINGEYVHGAYPYDVTSPNYQPGMPTFKQMIQDALNKAGS